MATQSDDLLTGGLAGGSPDGILTGGLVASAATSFAPGDVTFSAKPVHMATELALPGCVIQFADGDRPFQAVITARRTSDNTTVDAASLIAGVKVAFSFGRSPTSAQHVWIDAAWLGQVNVAKLVNVGAGAGGAALSAGSYYAHVRFTNGAGDVLQEDALVKLVVR